LVPREPCLYVNFDHLTAGATSRELLRRLGEIHGALVLYAYYVRVVHNNCAVDLEESYVCGLRPIF
jgi:hypothetical protein